MSRFATSRRTFLAGSLAASAAIASSGSLHTMAFAAPAKKKWEVLFNGTTLDGWHAVPKESAPDWTVRDGAIVGRGSADRLSYLVLED